MQGARGFSLRMRDALVATALAAIVLLPVFTLHLERAAVPGEQQLDEFDGAHKNFDLAYLTANDPGHLCRALQVAELVLANEVERSEPTFPRLRSRGAST